MDEPRKTKWENPMGNPHGLLLMNKLSEKKGLFADE
jgi:hypothetical protein